MTTRTKTTNPSRSQSLQAQMPQHLPSTRTPRTFGYCMLAADSPESVESEHLQKIAEFIISHDLPPLTEIVSDPLPPGCRYPQLPILHREGGSRLLRVLRRGDHVAFAELRAFLSIPDARRTLESLDARGVVVHIIDVTNGKSGSQPLSIDGRDLEQRASLNTALAIWSFLRSAARWSWPTKRQTCKRRPKRPR